VRNKGARHPGTIDLLQPEHAKRIGMLAGNDRLHVTRFRLPFCQRH
jgi:hypothetical protein